MFGYPLKKGLKNKRVRTFVKEEIEPQEVFLDDLAQKKGEELGVSEQKLEVPLSKKIIQGFFAFFLFIFFIFFAVTFYFQVLKGGEFLLLAKENKLRISFIKSDRGVIYDKWEEQIVFNRPSFDLVCDKRDLPKNEKEKSMILEEISRIINKDFGQIKKGVETSESSRILISENIDNHALILLETSPILRLQEETAGCQIIENTIRDYISAPTFAHLIGYTGKVTKEDIKNSDNYSIEDYIGKIGIEKSYENILRGKPGKIQIEKDVSGQVKSEAQVSNPETGKSLTLYLDSKLQRKVEEALKSTMQKIGAKKGVAVAMDPKTGGILSMVSLPSFDNNLFNKGGDSKILQETLNDPLNPLFNLVISGEYPTGSTIKPLIASAALQEKIISPEKTIYDSGRIEIPNEYDPEIIYTFMDWMPHGTVDMRKAIAVSCNVYFYTVGGGYKDQKGLGPARIKKYLELFGWGQKTGVDLYGENEGLVPDPAWKKEKKGEGWYVGNTYNLSIGQGDLGVTPLQVVTAFSAIANGGKLLQPQVVQKIVDDKGGTVEEINPKIIRENFIDPENLEIVREGMREAVTYGSSVILNDLPVKAASKTGTAETGMENVFHNWVTVFAPYEDPQIVLTILLENVHGLQAAALPVAKEVLGWYFQ